MPKKLNSWSEGGCWLLAQAVHDVIGEGSELAAVWDGNSELVDHVVVQIGDDCYLDAKGTRDEAELLDEAMEEGVGDPYIGPFDPRATGRIRCPAAALHKLREELRVVFSLPR